MGHWDTEVFGLRLPHSPETASQPPPWHRAAHLSSPDIQETGIRRIRIPLKLTKKFAKPHLNGKVLGMVVQPCNLTGDGRLKIGRSWLKAARNKCENAISKITRIKKAWDVDQRFLLYKHRFPSSCSSNCQSKAHLNFSIQGILFRYHFLTAHSARNSSMD
jgi:hypothetical protein